MWLETLRLAVQALVRNRSRSLLTMLGIIIGVAAVVVTVAIGTGARNAVQEQILSLGSNMIVVIPGNITQNGVNTGTGAASSLTVDDGLAIRKLDGVAAVSPAVGMRAQVIANGRNWSTQIGGSAPTILYIRKTQMASGTYFDDAQVAAVAKVCVLGQTVVDNLFPNENPLGKTVIIRNVPFTVIGVLAKRGQSPTGQDQDDVVAMPYTSVMQRLTGQTYVSVLLVSAKDEASIGPVQNEITTLLEERHRIVPPEQDDFSVRNLADIATAASSTASIMQALLAAVAAVSLLVGGIGIMNIMLVSVTERTREIGLRLSVGARGSAILQQFLSESVVLSTTGGLIGAICGILGAQLVASIGHWPATIPAAAVLVAIVFSAMVGIFFGWYPASRAARLDPIAALRAE